MTAQAVLITVAVSCLAAGLLQNGDFEAGIAHWGTRHDWYEQPKGAGLSAITVADGEGRGGSRALKIVGNANRGIAMQVPPAYPGRYRASGWIKCDGLDAASAVILAEWIGRDGTWLRGDTVGKVTGTQDWQHVEATLEPPPGTRSVHLDLLTTDANHGTAWFDDVTLERIPSEGPAPRPPVLTAATPEGREGCLQATWDAGSLGDQAVRLLVYCEPKPLDRIADLVPRTVADADAGECMIWSLENGKTYHVAAVVVDADGRASARSEGIQAGVQDRQPPRGGWLEGQSLGNGNVEVGWTPHVLDDDIVRLHVGYRGQDEGELIDGKQVEVARPLSATRGRAIGRSRPFYCTEPLLKVTLPPARGRDVGAWCEDRAGNRSEIIWAEVRPAQGPRAALAGSLWAVAPTVNVPPDAAPAEGADATVSLELMRGQAKGFQIVVRPDAPLHHARVTFGPLMHEDGGDRIQREWLAYHFVNYVELEKNSRATPPEELVWPAPAEYPDELSDDRSRDLEPGRAQPIYIRVTSPRDARPGTYVGTAHLQGDEGEKAFEIRVRVVPVALPEQPRLKFVYWFGWGEPCKRFDVEQDSEDGWRVLARLGELMRAHHQNTVTVPWGLVHSWRKPDGTLVHDFRDFDRYVRTFQEEGADALFCLQHMGSRTTGEWECPTMQSHRQRVLDLANGEADSMDVIDLLPALQAHIGELGLLKRFAVHVADEPIPVNLASYRELSARVKAAAPDLRRIDAVHVPNLEGALEIWVPQLNYFEQWLDQYRAAQREGNEIWLYVAWVPQGKYPNRMIDNSAIKPRVLHWLNAIYDTSGYLHWALNWWGISLMSLQSPGDQYICWPSQRCIANSSLRYEAEREGLEDCELMFMLRDALERKGASRADAQAQVEAIARVPVRSFQDYTRSWQELEDARHRLLEALIQAGGTER